MTDAAVVVSLSDFKQIAREKTIKESHPDPSTSPPPSASGPGPSGSSQSSPETPPEDPNGLKERIGDVVEETASIYNLMRGEKTFKESHSDPSTSRSSDSGGATETAGGLSKRARKA